MIRIKTNIHGDCDNSCDLLQHFEEDDNCIMQWDAMIAPCLRTHLCPAVTNEELDGTKPPRYVILCDFDREFKLVLE